MSEDDATETFDYQPEALLDGGPVLWIGHLVADDGFHELLIAPSFETEEPQVIVDADAFEVCFPEMLEEVRAYAVWRMCYIRVTPWTRLRIEDQPHEYARVVMMQRGRREARRECQLHGLGHRIPVTRPRPNLEALARCLSRPGPTGRLGPVDPPAQTPRGHSPTRDQVANGRDQHSDTRPVCLDRPAREPLPPRRREPGSRTPPTCAVRSHSRPRTTSRRATSR